MSPFHTLPQHPWDTLERMIGNAADGANAGAWKEEEEEEEVRPG